MKKLRIAQIAPIWFDVPPKNYGGTERIISFITEALVERGHEVTLFATPGSQTKAKLLSPFDHKLLSNVSSYLDPTFQRINMTVNEEVYKMASQFDIVHSHGYYFSFPYAEVSSTPTIHTIHNQLPRKNQVENAILHKYRNLNFVSVSNEFRSHFDLNYIATIYHGIDLRYFPFSRLGGDSLFWIGRADKEKGELEAIEVAQRTGKKLSLAMSVRKSSETYLETKIKPHINGNILLSRDVRFEDTARYYDQAKALIFPLEWREPFGLVFVESMACGTPVIAYSRGSVPEIIKDGETGFVVNPSEKEHHGEFSIKKTGIEGLCEAVERLYTLSPADYVKMRLNCRKHVEQNFTSKRMVSNYEKLYYRLITKSIGSTDRI